MESGVAMGRLVGSEIHGFHTLQDLDVANMMEEARSRWLRPNEIHAILCNHKYFSVKVKPLNLPPSGTMTLFDRKMLRNFRKDGHNWKKKKDGKTVKEAHEHLKVGNEERIHVYYAHGQENPTFVRRCYWLLDKKLEHIVLVHYRETQESQSSPATPGNSNSGSSTDPPTSGISIEELDSGIDRAFYADPGDGSVARKHELTLHEINTLEWEELLITNGSNDSTMAREDKVSSFGLHDQVPVNGSVGNGSNVSANNELAFGNLAQLAVKSDDINCSIPDTVSMQPMWNQVNSNMQRRESPMCTGDSLSNIVYDDLHSQDSFGRWMNHIMIDSPASKEDPLLALPILSDPDSLTTSALSDNQPSIPEQIFYITDFSPGFSISTEKTKILVTGFFHEGFVHLAKSNLFCVCGDVYEPAEIIQPGVYRCLLSPHSSGLVNLYMSLDGHKPISQVLSFEYRAPLLQDPVVSVEEKSKWEEFQVQTRLAHLLFSTSKSLSILSSKVSPNALKLARKFASKTSHISEDWAYLIKLIEEEKCPFLQAKDNFFELALKNRLKEWLLEKVIEGGKSNEYDKHGQGVIHLCAILGYTWAVNLFSLSGLSLDYRDKFGWTALHWAAYCGREKMVAVLLSAGAKPNYVTDPTPNNPGGCIAADLASIKGYEGLAAYLAEKNLVQQFEDMVIAGNVSGTLRSSVNDVRNTAKDGTEEELNLKDTLEAYRTAADAAARIQSAFREHSLYVQTKAVQYNNPESEAQSIIAALKIQHAYRNFETRKKMAAAARIQHRFRTWKIRQEFLNMRRQAIKIQAAFRAFQARRQYCKVLWSVGVLEKAILRWRLKRKGFRGLETGPIGEGGDDEQQESNVEEDFFRASRKQAEERVERSVVRVQAMFRSKKAQEEYRRMKLTHDQATMDYLVEHKGLNNATGMDL